MFRCGANGTFSMHGIGPFDQVGSGARQERSVNEARHGDVDIRIGPLILEDHCSVVKRAL